MSFYADIFYSESFYGGDAFGVGSGGPANLNAYQNNIDTAVLYWTLDPNSPNIHNMVWTVETDTDSGFASADLRTYVSSDSKIELDGALITGNTISIDVDSVPVSAPFNTDSNTTLSDLAAAVAAEPGVASATVEDAGSGSDDDRIIIIRHADIEAPALLENLSITGGASQASGIIDSAFSFIEGRLHKGVAVPIYDRAQGEERPMYWRVKGTWGAVDTPVIETLFNMPQAIDEVVRDASLELMPDPIYKKDADANNYKMHWVFGKSIDDHYVGDLFAENDISLLTVRDISLQGKFGNMVDITRPQVMKAIDFREIMRQFWSEARFSPTVRSVRNMVRACLGVEPTITLIRDTLSTYVNDTTAGDEVVETYIPDDDYYQLITFDGPLVTGNTYTVEIDSIPVATPFNTDSDTTMQDIANNLALEPGISFGAVVDVPGADNDRVIVLRAAVPATPPVITNSLVTGGASQAVATPSSEGTVLAPEVWDNVHLAGGVIVEVTNPFGAIVSKQFLQDIIRKLVLAHHPVYVIGIT